jgi:bifunctional non-homologous end joining protein LigD
MRLTDYKKKRDFKKTPEPKTKKATQSAHKKLYVIQKHDASHLHYDFRLEHKGVLLSWAVPKGPSLDPSVKRLAVHVEDHPLQYGSFEGTIPKGQYGAGTVEIWDRGEWQSLDANPTKAYHQGAMIFLLKGKKLKGKWKLVRINKNDKTWLLIKVDDKYAKSQDDAELVPSKFPKMISPELATLADQPPSGKNWLHEIKFDGYRIIAFKKDNKVKLFTRNQLDWTKKFPNVVSQLNRIKTESFIIDGEIVVLDNKQHSNFELLQNAIKNKSNNFIYFIFDLLYMKKYDISFLSLIERKKLLKKILPKNNSTLQFSNHIVGSGKKLYKKACKMGLEGIISKDSHSPYIQKRTQDWVKAKCVKRQEFIIVGFTSPKNRRSCFGSLILATYNKNKELIYNGHVGTGFNAMTLSDIHKKLLKYATNIMPFKKKPKNGRRITWVKPVLVAEVEFSQWTKAGLLRQPSFKGLRKDKSPNSIIKETPIDVENKKKIKYTHLNKILYPEDKITKNELIEYYEFVKNWMLPYVSHRPLTLLRCPSNIKSCFYQRHETKKSKISKYIHVETDQELLMLPQLNALEIHPWGSKIDHLDNPDVIIFDLDPAPEVEWKTVVKAAKKIRGYLADLKLSCFLKTTGGKGLHIVIPIKPEYEWDEVSVFAKTFVNFLSMKNPDLFTHQLQKIHRKNRIFVDYLRNKPSATAIAPYSTRARLHAPIATPIDWDELTNQYQDTFFTLRTLPTRLDSLKKDPWEKYFKLTQSLKLNKYR